MPGAKQGADRRSTRAAAAPGCSPCCGRGTPWRPGDTVRRASRRPRASGRGQEHGDLVELAAVDQAGGDRGQGRVDAHAASDVGGARRLVGDVDHGRREQRRLEDRARVEHGHQRARADPLAADRHRRGDHDDVARAGLAQPGRARAQARAGVGRRDRRGLVGVGLVHPQLARGCVGPLRGQQPAGVLAGADQAERPRRADREELRGHRRQPGRGLVGGEAVAVGVIGAAGGGHDQRRLHRVEPAARGQGVDPAVG